MLDVLRFWCERGADGFRIDALRQLIKDDRRRDNPVNPAWREGDDPYDALLPEFTTDRPEVQDAIRAMRAAVGDERLLLGELYLPIERLVAYYASGLDMPANFHLLTTPWTAHDIADLVERYEAALPDGAWPNWVLGNHDRPRLATRARPRSGARRGVPAADAARHADALLRRRDRHARRRDPARATASTRGRSATATRCARRCSGTPPARSRRGEPWLPFARRPRARQRRGADATTPGSLLSLYRRLLALRRTEPDLIVRRLPDALRPTTAC